MKQIVLTGIRKLLSMEYVDTPERFVSGPASLELLTEIMHEEVKHRLIFNNGLFELDCDEKTFAKITAFFKPVMKTDEPKRKLAVLPTMSAEVPEGAQVFSATEDPPPPPEEEEAEEEQEEKEDDDEWVGAPDDAGDGVGQA